MELPHSVPFSSTRDAFDMSTKDDEPPDALQKELPMNTSPHAALGFCATSGTSRGYAASHAALVFQGTCSEKRSTSARCARGGWKRVRTADTHEV